MQLALLRAMRISNAYSASSEVPKPQSPPIPSQPKHKAVDDFSL
jgi:hypothetical protein